MIESFLFVPASKIKYIEKSKVIFNLNHRVFDLEDSIKETDFNLALDNLKNAAIVNTDWIRLPLNRLEEKETIEKIGQLKISNYVIPKFRGYHEFSRILRFVLSINQKAKMILMIENSRAFIDIEKILDKYNESIFGISLGIHDFSYETGMKNDYKSMKNIRESILILAKAYSVIPIDVVCPYLYDKEILTEEIIDGYHSGYRAKFIIHPFQFEIINSVNFYTKDEIANFKTILEYYIINISGKEVLFTYNHRVYEKMHIEEMKKIVEWGEKFYGNLR